MLDVFIENDIVYIKGILDKPFTNAVLMAAAPADRRTSYYGSGLPFPCATVAFNNTPNMFKIESPEFATTFRYPNSFYMPNAKDKIPPTIYLIVDDKIDKVHELPDKNSLKTLNPRYKAYDIPREYFYGFKDAFLPVANAEEIMIAYAKFKKEQNIA